MEGGGTLSEALVTFGTELQAGDYEGANGRSSLRIANCVLNNDQVPSSYEYVIGTEYFSRVRGKRDGESTGY